MKKKIYKENPKAKLLALKKGIAFYSAETSEGQVIFRIPPEDLSSADFEPEMEAKFLIRWLIDDYSR